MKTIFWWKMKATWLDKQILSVGSSGSHPVRQRRGSLDEDFAIAAWTWNKT